MNEKKKAIRGPTSINQTVVTGFNYGGMNKSLDSVKGLAAK